VIVAMCDALDSSGSTDRLPLESVFDLLWNTQLAGLLCAGEFTPVWIPGEEDESLRDLVRAREDANWVNPIAIC
jgi:hypothetical protein